MTIEEKREAIAEYCYSHGCGGCPVYPLVRDGKENCHSPGKDGVKDPNIERNYNLIFGGCKPESVNKYCGTCKHFDDLLSEEPEHCYDCWNLSKWEPQSDQESTENPYWERITAIAEKQRAKGMSKYGQGLEANPADILARINHLQEELIDGLMYCEWIKEWVQENLVKDSQG